MHRVISIIICHVKDLNFSRHYCLFIVIVAFYDYLKYNLTRTTTLSLFNNTLSEHITVMTEGSTWISI